MHRKQSVCAAALVLVGSLSCARADAPAEQVIKIVAKKWDFTPARIVLHKGVPVTIELTSTDRKHGFAVPDLGIRVDVKPNETVRVRIVPAKMGTFSFHCDVFCGDGHEGMTGELVVQP